MMAKAGEFELKVSAPYPCWAELSYRGERMGSFRHNELSDLQYAVTKAMQETRALLPERDRGEV